MTTSMTTISECHKLQPRKNSYRIKSENETLNKKVFSRRQKVERNAEDTTSFGKLFQIFGEATGNAVLPTACKRTEVTARRSVTAERSARRPGMSATRATTARLAVQQ